jgi:hypothetical protein
LTNSVILVSTNPGHSALDLMPSLASAGVVDEHVEAPVAVPVGGDHGLDDLLVAEVAGDVLDLIAPALQLLGGGLEVLRAS